MESQYESQVFEPNFVTVCGCEGFRLTLNFLDNLIKEAELGGRSYSWMPIVPEYWLPEKNHIDYEISCPKFEVIKSDKIYNKPTFNTIAYIQIGDIEVKSHFVQVFQLSGDLNQVELFLFARSISYLRFMKRDGLRNADVTRWNKLVEHNIASNDTVLLFQEDKDAAHLWADCNFSRENVYNAWIGKCGEFIFRGWCSQRGLSLTYTEIKINGVPDEYDFINQPSFFLRLKNSFLLNKEDIKIDVKTFQLEGNSKRDYWTINKRCTIGNHVQDLFVFVIISEDFRLGKVVGVLTCKEVKRKGKLHSYFDDFTGYENSYYKVKLADLRNTYYLRAYLDTDGQCFSLMETMGATNPWANLIKSYPIELMLIDEYDRFYDDLNDLFDDDGYSSYNLVVKPNLTMYIEKS